MVAIIYYTVSKQTERFVNKVKYECDKIELKDDNPFIEMEQPFICIIPSYEQHVLSNVYDAFDDFLSTGNNIDLCGGVFASGNRNFAQLFGVTAHELAEKYPIDILHYFEFQGTEFDINSMEKELKRIDTTSQHN